MDVLIAVLVGVIALLALGAQLLAGRAASAHAQNLMQMVAQTDERVKAYMRNCDKVLDRWMAMKAPENFAMMREESGIVEGAQHSTKQHFHTDAEIAEQLDRKRQDAEKATATLRAVRAQVNQEIQARDEQNGIPQTVLDFERQNGAPR